MDEASLSLEAETKPKCIPSTAGEGVDCTGCVCSYRNLQVDDSLSHIDGVFQRARDEAQILFSKDITEEVNNFHETEIVPWARNVSCNGIISSVSL